MPQGAGVSGRLYQLLSLEAAKEARFHAGYLFWRYYSLVDSEPMTVPQTFSDGWKGVEEAIAMKSGVWNTALSCLLISHKLALRRQFHHDTEWGFDAASAREYLVLSPYKFTLKEFGASQRDVLQTLGFRLGSATPGAYMDELWRALPTLSRMDGSERELIQDEAWEILRKALQCRKVLRFPLSVLTGAALVEAVVRVLAQNGQYDTFARRDRALDMRRGASLRKAASKVSREVRLGIQESLKISKQDLSRCQRRLGMLRAK
ncbi:hypothetical protein BD413DRAFT_132326 [Trametes elegans]|nr:hypothetical protein BD413DRAFT_132326 [Trametes elegans]